MKELSEKAKRYDEALKKAKDFYKGYKQRDNQLYADDLESLFPELKESEDETMSKSIIQTLKRYIKCVEDGHDAPSAKDFLIKDTEKQIAWLEKQGSQILANPAKTCKIEQKPWSEEDEEIYRKCICAMRASACGFPEEEKFVEQVDNWLKSIKERVACEVNCTTTKEWSAGDK